MSLVQYTALQIPVSFVYRLMHMNMPVGAVLDCGGLITEHMPTYIQYIHTQGVSFSRRPCTATVCHGMDW